VTLAGAKDFSTQTLSVKLKSQNSKLKDEFVGLRLTIGDVSADFSADARGVANVKLEDKFLTQKRTASWGAVPCLDAILTPFSRRSSTDSAADEAVNAGLKTKFCFVDEARSKLPVKFGLMSLDGGGERAGFLAVSQPAKSLPIEVIVTKAKEFDRLKSILAKQSRFSLVPVSRMDDQGLFGVADGQVSFEILGQPSAEIADKIMTMLGGSFVFKGNKSAVYDSSKMSRVQFDQWLQQRISDGKPVYFQSGDSVVPISSGFIKENPDVAKFVQNSAGSILLHDVQVISYSGD
jgi:hypothetical protein